MIDVDPESDDDGGETETATDGGAAVDPEAVEDLARVLSAALDSQRPPDREPRERPETRRASDPADSPADAVDDESDDARALDDRVSDLREHPVVEEAERLADVESAPTVAALAAGVLVGAGGVAAVEETIPALVVVGSLAAVLIGWVQFVDVDPGGVDGD